MNDARERIAAEAAQWHLATLDAETDWTAFTRWLEADPRHRLAYDEVARADAALVEHRAALAPALEEADRQPVAAPGRRWIAWSGAAVAASLAAALALQPFGGAGTHTYDTDANGTTIALADGSRVTLAPRSRLEISSDGERLALAGGAWFDIRHDPARRLSIEAGGVQITDIGTRFDVQSAAGSVRIEVAQGRVEVLGDTLAAPLELREGRALTFDSRAGTAVVAPVAANAIGEWRSGTLSFDGASLRLVAADLSRYAGIKVTVAEELVDRHFTGTLIIGNGDAAVRDLAQLMDVELGRSGDAYRLEPRAR